MGKIDVVVKGVPAASDKFEGHQVWLHVGMEQFPVGGWHDNPTEANWYAKQVREAMHDAVLAMAVTQAAVR